MNSELINELLNEILIERFEQVAKEKEPEIDLQRADHGEAGNESEEGIFYNDFRTDCLFLGFASGYENRCQETNFDMSILINEFNNKTTWHWEDNDRIQK